MSCSWGDDGTSDWDVPLPDQTAEADTVGWVFDTDITPWKVDYAVPSAMLQTSAIAFDAFSGMPNLGSLQATLPFDGPLQVVHVAVGLDAPMDLRGKTLTAQVRLDSGLGPDASAPGGVKLYVKSGDGFILADAGWVNITPEQDWVELTLPIDTPPGWIQPPSAAGSYDPADIRLIGISVETGATESAAWSPATVHIDTVGIQGELPNSKQPKPTPDARWTFDADVENWGLGFSAPSSLGEAATLELDLDSGNPDAPSLRLTVPFEAADQTIEILTTLPKALDLSGQTLGAMVRLDSGLSPDPEAVLCGVKVFVKSGKDQVWADGGMIGLTTGMGWIGLSFPIDQPMGMGLNGESYAPDDIRVIGLSFSTLSAVDPDAPAVFHIDTVGLADAPGTASSTP